MKMHPLAVYAIVLSTFLGYLGAGVGLGYCLWHYAGFPWWLMVVTGFLGMGLASWQTIRLQKKIDTE